MPTKTFKAADGFLNFQKLPKPSVKESPTQKLTPEHFPQGLSDLSSPPKEIFCRGMLNPRALANPVAIVGTRKPTEYGRNFAYAIAKYLAERNFTIISGLALGIDAAAHEGAIDGNGATVAVLGTGIDIIYPSDNKNLFEAIAKRGLLMTQFPLGMPPDKSTFPQRNQLIAGMARALIVIESDTSGGAMITATIAKKIGRRIFALPGRVDQPTSRGPHKLIQAGATLITSPENFLQEFSRADQPELFPIVTTRKNSRKKKEPQKAIPLPNELWPLSQGEALTLDELAQKSATSVSKLMGILLGQEIEGTVVKRLDGKYEAI